MNRENILSPSTARGFPERQAPEPEQLYCVAAADRNSKKRRAITGGIKRLSAIAKKNEFMHSMKKTHRYFHVAKYPYKAKP